MQVKRATLAALAAMALLTGCDNQLVSTDHRPTLTRELRQDCASYGGVQAFSALGYGSYGHTNGILIVCKDGTVVADDD